MKIFVQIEVPDDFDQRLDVQPLIEQEIKADRWSWHRAEDAGLAGSADNVVRFPGKASDDIDPDGILEKYKGKLAKMVLLGEDFSGDYIFASNTPNSEKLLMLVEQFKLSLLLGEFGE